MNKCSICKTLREHRVRIGMSTIEYAQYLTATTGTPIDAVSVKKWLMPGSVHKPTAAMATLIRQGLKDREKEVE